MYHVKPVRGLRTLRDFIALPHLVREGTESAWIPTFKIVDLYLMYSKGGLKNRFFVAYYQGEPVGRIGVRLPSSGDESVAHFGFFDCVEGHPEAALALAQQLDGLLPGVLLRGPYQFGMEDPFLGILVHGQELPPTFLLSHTPEHYGPYLELAGFVGVMDLNTFRFEAASDYSLFKRAAKRAKREDITIRSLDPKRRRQDIQSLLAFFNEALKGNWGFEPFGFAAFLEMYLFSYVFMDPDCLLLAEKDGELVGAVLVLLNFNEYFDSESGWSVLHKLWKRPLIRSSRGWALAVREDFQGSSVANALMLRGLDRLGPEWEWLDASWVLASNKPFNRMLTRSTGPPVKIHRVYERVAACSTGHSV